MAVIVTIGGTDVTQYIRPLSSLKIPSRAPGEVGTFSARFVDQTPYALNILNEQDIIVTDSGTRIFGGRVRTVGQADFNVQGIKNFTVDGQSYQTEPRDSICDVNANRTASESDKARITWLFSTFDTKGITVGTKVQTVLATMPGPQDFTGMSLEEALDDICKYTGARWWIDENKELNYALAGTVSAPFNIDIQSPNNTTTFPAKDFKLPLDTVDYVTDLFVIGDGISGWRTIASPPFSNRREASLKDQSIKDAAALAAVGDAWLAGQGKAKTSGSMTVWRAGLRAGQNILITNSQYGLAAKSYQILAVDPQFGDPNGFVLYDVDFGDMPPPDISQLIKESTDLAQQANDQLADVAANTPDLSTLDSAGANLVQNSQFANAAGASWSVASPWAIQYASASPLPGYAGTVARLVSSGSASGELVSDYIPVDRTDDWWFSFWSHLIARSAGNAQCLIREYNSSNTLLATTTLADITAVQANWTRHFLHFGPDSSVSGRVAFQAGTTKIKVVFRSTNSPNLTWEITGVQVERGGLLTAYAPNPQELNDNAITSTKIADNAITTPKLISNAVVADKIAAAAVTADKIAAHSINVGLLAQPQTSLVPNPGFELDGANGVSPTGWTGSPSSNVLVAGFGDGTVVHSGLGAVKLVQPSPVQNVTCSSPLVPVEPNRRYWVRAWARGSSSNSGSRTARVRVTWADASGAALSSVSFTVSVPNNTTWVLAESLRVSDPNAVYASVQLQFDSTSASAGNVIFFDDAEFYRADLDLNHAQGNVQIDGSGIHILNGMIDLQDAYGGSVLSARGFSGSWLGFLMNRVYNSSFEAGSTSDIPVSEVGGGAPTSNYDASVSANLPYWVVKQSGTVLQCVTDAAAPSGRALKFGATAIGQTSEIYQDVPVDGLIVPAVEFLWKQVGGNPRIQLSYRDANHNLVGTAVSAGADADSGTVYTRYRENRTLPAVPTNAKFLRVGVLLDTTNAADVLYIGDVSVNDSVIAMQGANIDSQSVPSGSVFTTLQLGVAALNVGAMLWDSATPSRIWLPLPGVYLVQAIAWWDAGTQTRRILTLKRSGGTLNPIDERTFLTGGTSVAVHQQADWRIYSSNGTGYLEVQASQNGGSALNITQLEISAVYIG